MGKACSAIPAQPPCVSPTLQNHHGVGFSALVVPLLGAVCC